jgi:hypothetical protein
VSPNIFVYIIAQYSGIVNRKIKKPRKTGHEFYQNQVIETNTVKIVTATEIISVKVFDFASLLTPLTQENARANILKNATAGRANPKAYPERFQRSQRPKPLNISTRIADNHKITVNK